MRIHLRVGGLYLLHEHLVPTDGLLQQSGVIGHLQLLQLFAPLRVVSRILNHNTNVHDVTVLHKVTIQKCCVKVQR